jgi:hypothetical protein
MILVTGSTGLIGGEVLRRLSQSGVPARALTRDVKKARQMPGVTWVGADLGRPETLPKAFEGTDTLFLLTHYLEDMVELQHNAISGERNPGRRRRQDQAQEAAQTDRRRVRQHRSLLGQGLTTRANPSGRLRRHERGGGCRRWVGSASPRCESSR